MKVPYFIPWINQQDKKFVVKAMGQRWLTNGPFLTKFEEKFRKFISSKYSLGVSSATHALHLSLRSIGIQPNDEVILPTMTFVATLAAVSYCGAKPVLTDVDLDTLNISQKNIEKKITKKTRAIMVVHYGGQACDMDEIMEISKKHGLFVVEDCAHSLGATYKKRKSGNIGNFGCFSFYPTKIITTGEGGMVTTNDYQFFRKMKLLRSHGIDTSANEREKLAKWSYDITELGYNYRLDELRSALGFSQLSRIRKSISLRQKIAKKYDKEIRKIKGLIIPYTKSDRNHIYHLYTIKIERDYHLTRDKLFQKLYKNGVGTSVQYFPLHLMSFYKKKDYNKKNEFKNSNLLKDQVLCLPIFPQMTSKQVAYVISFLK